MRHTVRIPADVARAFGIAPDVTPLPGGDNRTYRSGGVVLREEHNAELTDALFAAELFGAVEDDAEFRVPRPLRAGGGGWLQGRWSAWTFVEGRQADVADAPAMVRAIEAFHRAVAHVPCPEYLGTRVLVYDRADRGAFGEPPPDVDHTLRPVLDKLYALRRPLDRALRPQVIHGDLGAHNVLIAADLPPAIIDFAPYWRPPEFAVAVAALWLCGYQGHTEAIAAFDHVREFDQLLLRALIRTLLVTDGYGSSVDVIPFGPSIDLVTARVRRAQAR